MILDGRLDEVRAIADDFTSRAVAVLREVRRTEGRALLEGVALELSRRSR